MTIGKIIGSSVLGTALLFGNPSGVDENLSLEKVKTEVKGCMDEVINENTNGSNEWVMYTNIIKKCFPDYKRYKVLTNKEKKRKL